jgi:hypothetical protein
MLKMRQRGVYWSDCLTLQYTNIISPAIVLYEISVSHSSVQNKKKTSRIFFEPFRLLMECHITDLHNGSSDYYLHSKLFLHARELSMVAYAVSVK